MVATGDDQNFGNKIMTTLGLAASVYTLGMKDAAVLTAKKVTNSNGQVWGTVKVPSTGSTPASSILAGSTPNLVV